MVASLWSVALTVILPVWAPAVMVAELSGLVTNAAPKLGACITQFTTLLPGRVLTLALVALVVLTVLGLNRIGPICTSCIRSHPSPKQAGVAVNAALTLIRLAILPALISAGLP